MAETIDLLVEGDFLLPMIEGVPVITGAEVAVRNGRIVHAGPPRPAGSWAAAQTIRGRGHAILPGFVNAHCHTASIVFRSQTDDPPGGITLYTIGFRGEQELNAEEWHDLAGVGAIDMVKAGITTINDIYYEPDGLAEACAALGLRAQLCDEIFDVAKENLADGDYTRYPERGAAKLKKSLEFSARWHGKADGRITTRLGPHAVDTCAREFLKEIASEARRLGIGLHIHAAQSAREVEVVKQMYGRSSLEHMAALGVMGPDTVLAHLTFASAADLDAVRDAKALSLPHDLSAPGRLSGRAGHPRPRHSYGLRHRLDDERSLRGHAQCAERAAAEGRSSRCTHHGRGALVRHHGQRAGGRPR
jgi:5-methylthioadenosine/S-adenosylhomocysteine deaminase